MARSIGVFAIIFISCHVTANANGAGSLRPFLERFKNLMKTGNDSLGMPVFDPFESDEETLHVEISYVLADLILTDLRMTGLSNYDVKMGTYSMGGLHMELAFRWNEIVTKTDYNIEGVLADKYPIYGKGKLTGIIRGLNVTCVLDIALGLEGLEVKKIVSTVDVESLNVEATGLYNDEKRSKMLSKMISRLGPDMIRRYPLEAGKIMSDITEKKANQILKNLSVKDLLDLIKE